MIKNEITRKSKISRKRLPGLFYILRLQDIDIRSLFLALFPKFVQCLWVLGGNRLSYFSVYIEILRNIREGSLVEGHFNCWIKFDFKWEVSCTTLYYHETETLTF